MTRLGFTLVLVVAVLAMADTASAKEYPVGASQEKNGMEIGAVYLQPIEMDPPGVMRPAAESDVHLESDVKAAKDNKNGFAEGEWIPYLAVARPFRPPCRQGNRRRSLVQDFRHRI
jgi:uncharacterized protein involved in high-affinity Fe2+ transport